MTLSTIHGWRVWTSTMFRLCPLVVSISECYLLVVVNGNKCIADGRTPRLMNSSTPLASFVNSNTTIAYTLLFIIIFTPTHLPTQPQWTHDQIPILWKDILAQLSFQEFGHLRRFDCPLHARLLQLPSINVRKWLYASWRCWIFEREYCMNIPFSSFPFSLVSTTVRWQSLMTFYYVFLRLTLSLSQCYSL